MRESEMQVDNRWHLDKRLNVGHILTTLILTISVLAWAQRMDMRLTTVEVKQANNIQNIENFPKNENFKKNT